MDTWFEQNGGEPEPRRRNSKAADDFAALPKEFTAEDVAKQFNLEYNTAGQRICRWITAGYIKDSGIQKKPKVYVKCVNAIVV